MKPGWFPRILLLILAPGLLAAASPQGTPPPPPRPPIWELISACPSVGVIECIKTIFAAYQWLGLCILALIVLALILVIKPNWRNIEERLSDFYKPFWDRIFPEKHTDEQKAAFEENYLLILDQQLKNEKDPSILIEEYLKKQQSNANPLRPTEEAEYVALAGSIYVDLKPNLILMAQSDSAPIKGMFEERGSFPDLSEAMAVVDPQTGYPYPALALLGEPGSGKSTLLRKFARDAVRRRLDDPSAPLPFFVTLSDYRAGMPLDFLRRQWRKAVGYDGFDNALASGCIWLFADGLNEMERRGYEERAERLRAFLSRNFLPDGNRALVACRVADYGEGLVIPRLMIRPMDEARIKDFILKRALYRYKEIWGELERDRKEGRGDLLDLAKVPFWLDMMTRIPGKLPRNKAALVSAFLNQWLDYEASRPGGVALTPEGRSEFIKGLTRLGWYGLKRSQNYKFTQKEAYKVLKRHFFSRSLLPPKRQVDLACSCSLLTGDKARVWFFHQLLQEYFAGVELSSRFVRGKALGRLWRIPWRKWEFVDSRWDSLPGPPSTGWEEATVLGCGLLDPDQVDRLVLSILPRNAPLAARCLVETEVNASESVQNAVSKQLLIQVNSPKERLAARLAAGKALGRLGDPRMHSRQSVVTLADGKTVSFIAPDWVEVPQGAFMMGSLATDKLSSGDEQPQHDVLLSKGYRIGRFPVTVAEYRCFLEAEGYSNDEYWQDEAGLRWLRGELSFEESYQAQLFNIFTEDKERVQRYYEHEVREKRIAPYMADAVIRGLDKPVGAYIEEWQNLEKEHRDETGRASHPWLWDDPDYTISNQPVVGVSFYEARAYADWLEKVMSSAGLVPPGFHVRLPYEAEWEKAARGVDARRWPWGIRWDTGRANTLEGRVLSPSPVGIYPHGASPYSAQDMAGNVWQWCQDWYDENEYARRAGSAVTDPRGPESG